MKTFEIGETYYVADPFDEEMYTKNTWRDGSIEKRFNDRGLCFKTEEEALAKSKSMIEGNKKHSYPQIMKVWYDTNPYKRCRLVVGEVCGKFMTIDDDDVPPNTRSLKSLETLIHDKSSFEVSIFDKAEPVTKLEQYLLDRSISIEEIDVIRQLALNEK